MNLEFDRKEYARKARQLAAEGCVMLKNDNYALPLKKGMRVSLFGRSQFRYIKSGTGSGGMVHAPYVVSIPDALKEEKDISLNENLENIYKEWLKANPFDNGGGWVEPWYQTEMEVSSEICEEAAKKSDIAIVVIGRNAGEEKDSSATKGAYYLADTEKDLLQKVRGAFCKMVVLLNVGNIMDMNWVDEINPDALLYVWQGGQEGGHGVADVLMGRENPSGKLPDTIFYNLDEDPVLKNFGSTSANLYEEDIYVGYRYYETIAKEKVQYPFGYGLSYTDFEMEAYVKGDLKNNAENGKDIVKIGISVTNTGKMQGKEVVEVYCEGPDGALNKPARELVGFKKTKRLSVGETEKFEIDVPLKYMASYDDSGVTGHKSSWVLEKGDYSFYVGNSVRNAKLAGKINFDEIFVVEQCKEICSPVVSFKRMVIDKEKQTILYENVPLRSYDLEKRVLSKREDGVGYLGDKEITFVDVLKKSATVEELISELTDEDLICLTRGEGPCSSKVTEGIVGSFGGVSKRLHDIYKIPVAGTSDGPSGIRMDNGKEAFSLPSGTLQAASFNTELIQKLYEFEGMELRSNKIDTLLGPGINIHRCVLNGRNFEYFSEDPFLAGKCTVAQLTGMHKYGVTGTIKHFACNDQETERNNVDACVSERALREIYFKAFEMAVREAGAYCIMTSYNPLNGIHTSSSHDLNNELIRDEWGFDGITMTDWWAKADSDDGKDADKIYAHNMIRARGDVYMITKDAEANDNKDLCTRALAEGRITRGDLETVAKDILKTLSKMLVSDRMLHGEDEIKEYDF